MVTQQYQISPSEPKSLEAAPDNIMYIEKLKKKETMQTGIQLTRVQYNHVTGTSVHIGYCVM